MNGDDARRAAPWDGGIAFADLGGIRLVSGAETAFGQVFRSGTRDGMTTIGWRQAREAGVGTVIDLRNADEVGGAGRHPAVAVEALDGIDVVHVPIEDPDDPEFLRVCGPWLDHPRYYADNVAMYPSRFAAVFGAIARAPGGVLIHCSAGRDRTGLVAAMLLSLAGAKPRAIAADYERAARAFNEHLLAGAVHGSERGRTPGEMDERMRERTSTLATWVRGFDVAEYLADAGVGLTDLSRLRTLLLETAGRRTEAGSE